MKAGLLALFLTFASSLSLAATEAISLNNRMAEDVIEVARSVLGHEGRVTAYGNQLIVNAPSERIEELKSLLQQLDRPARRLLISVDTQDSLQQHDQGYRVDGSARIGDVEVISGRGERHGNDQVRIINRSTQTRSGGLQQIQASEGYPALIQTGQSVPLQQRGTGPYGQVYQSTEYRNVTRGIYVTATLSGELVHITLSSHNDRLSQQHPGSIDTQLTDTRISGRLGEWITLGGISEQRSGNDSAFLRQHSTQGSQDMGLRIKVEALD